MRSVCPQGSFWAAWIKSRLMLVRVFRFATDTPLSPHTRNGTLCEDASAQTLEQDHNELLLRTTRIASAGDVLLVPSVFLVAFAACYDT